MEVRPSARMPGNLPVEVTSFVGRRHELARARELLGTGRLVTLTGPGGVGKSRLALRAAAESRRAFGDGVWLVELATLRDGTAVARAVASALGMKIGAGSVVDELARFVGDKRLLLVLDNCEHLLDACAELASRLLAAAPEVRVLATSREPLTVAGEHLLDVMPLTVPEAGRRETTEDIELYEAPRLFCERASAAAPGFAATADSCEVIAAVCRRLDGIPLAIELAAVWVRSLSVERILDRLDDRFALLARGRREALPRQQTLRATIDWSHDLCTEKERLLWARLSVFVGGWDLAAAEAVCADDAIEAAEVMDLLAALIDKSVVRTGDQGPERRYDMLETIRAYGQDMLTASGEADTVRGRHRDHLLRLTRCASDAWFGPRQLHWLSRLNLEYPNIRAALTYSLDTRGEAQGALEIIAALGDGYTWLASAGSGGDIRDLLRRALDQDHAPTPARAKALLTAGQLALYGGELDEAAPLLDEGRSLAERLGDRSLHACVTEQLGAMSIYRGDTAGALALLEEGRAEHRQARSRTNQRWLGLLALAIAAALNADTDRAESVGKEALALADAADARASRPYALWALALAAFVRGDLSGAESLLKDALRPQQSLHDLWLSAMCVERLAAGTALTGRHERAAHLLGIADHLWRTLGSTLNTAPSVATFHRECETQTRRELGETAFATAHRRGATLTFDQALAYALEEQASGPPTEPACEPSPLTRREQQVARLVADGRTNKEIASSLVISQRTAECHVENIRTKLGFTNRTQIATWINGHTG